MPDSKLKTLFDLEKVTKVASLAKLKLKSDEVEVYAKELSQILEHFEQLAQISTEGIEPLVTPHPINLVLRPDIAVQNQHVDQIVEQAPQRSGHLFKVPPVL